MTGVLIVFAKVPRPGEVKTRMAPHFSLQDAAAFYSCLLDDVLTVSEQACAVLGLDLLLAVAPAAACAELSRRLGTGTRERVSHSRVIAQHGRDLSERMQWACAEAGAAGYRRILLRGSDSPLLSEDHLEEVLAALDEAPLAVVPDQGGGYALLGLREPIPGLFDHPMSTPDVLEATRHQAERRGFEMRTCRPTLDLDTPEDLGRLLEGDRAQSGSLCPRTLKFLSEKAA